MSDKTDSQKSDRASIHTIGMTCTTCTATIEKGLSEVPAIDEAIVDFAPGSFPQNAVLQRRTLHREVEEIAVQILTDT